MCTYAYVIIFAYFVLFLRLVFSGDTPGKSLTTKYEMTSAEKERNISSILSENRRKYLDKFISNTFTKRHSINDNDDGKVSK